MSVENWQGSSEGVDDQGVGPGGLIKVGDAEACDGNLCGAKVVGAIDQEGHTEEIRYECGHPECPYGHCAYVRERAKKAGLRLLTYWLDNPDYELVHLKIEPPGGWVHKSPDSLERFEKNAQEKAKEYGGVEAGYSFRDGWGISGTISREEECQIMQPDGLEWRPSYHILGFRRPGDGREGEVGSGWIISEVSTVDTGSDSVVENAREIISRFELALRKVTFRPEVEGGPVGDRYRHFGELAQYSSDPSEEVEDSFKDAYHSHFKTESFEERECEECQTKGGGSNENGQNEIQFISIWSDEAGRLIERKVTDWPRDTWREIFKWRELLTGQASIPEKYQGEIRREPPPGIEGRSIAVQGSIPCQRVVKKMASAEPAQREQQVIFWEWVDKFARDFDKGAVPEDVLIEILELYGIPEEKIQGEDGLLMKNFERGKLKQTRVEGKRGWQPIYH